jgi:tetratricopeptide (TPR) repeat protein
LRVLIAAESGPREAALRATQAISAPNLDITWTCSAAALSLAYAMAGDTKNAAVLYDALLPYEKQVAVLGFGVTSMGAVARYLGKLAETLGRFEASARHYETAIDINTRSRSLPWLAHTQHDYGRLLLARGDGGSDDRARELMGAALERAEEIGMFGLLESMRGRPPNQKKHRPRSKSGS